MVLQLPEEQTIKETTPNEGSMRLQALFSQEVFPLPSGPSFGATRYEDTHFTMFYSLVSFQKDEAFPSVPVTALLSPVHSN